MQIDNQKVVKTKAYYTDLKHQAAILYIKHGLSAKEINKRLGVAMASLAKWCEAGKWNELRPDLLTLKEYKAAHLYINDALSIGAIAMKLSVSEVTVRFWIDLNRWNTVKQVTATLDTSAETVNSFCNYFKKSFPRLAAEIEVIRNEYINRNIQQIKP